MAASAARLSAVGAAALAAALSLVVTAQGVKLPLAKD